MSTTKSIRVFRRLSGAIEAELRVETSGEVATHWQIKGINSRYPYAIIDGHRYDLAIHEVMALRKAVREL